jgi:hypothetical protein
VKALTRGWRGVFSNPRHVPLTDEQTQEMRRKVRSVVVDGADVLSVERGRAVVEREVVTAQVSTVSYLLWSGLMSRVASGKHYTPPHNPAGTSAVLLDVPHNTSIIRASSTS